MVLGDLEAVCLDVLSDGLGTDFLLGLVVRAVVREVFIVLAEEFLSAVSITFAIFRRLEVGDDHVALFVDFQFEDAGVVAAGDELEGVALDVVVLDPVVAIDGSITVDDVGGDVVDDRDADIRLVVGLSDFVNQILCNGIVDRARVDVDCGLIPPGFSVVSVLQPVRPRVSAKTAMRIMLTNRFFMLVIVLHLLVHPHYRSDKSEIQ